MLTLTREAAIEIRNLCDRPEVPDGGGVRIANDIASGSLSLSVAAVPAEDDQVLDASGARLFIEPQAAVLLDDKTLDAAPGPDGRVQFEIAPQVG